MKVVMRVFLGVALIAMMSPLHAVQQKNDYQAQVFNATQHELFQNLYTKPTINQSKQAKPSKIKALIKSLKNSVDLGLHENVKVKVSRVKSGPLEQSITQVVEMAPGIQTHEGFIGDSSKGYGVKFSYQF